ncbi:MAG: helix-turn-helix transcriptional regulator [Elusimicrobia bacterium]|nr:helix-turn-helix transcriptional regulator [Elusimicrobiota bacterium]
METNGEDVAAILESVKCSMGPEPVELLLEAGETTPVELRSWPSERMFQYLRCRLRFTQLELAQKAGLTQSQVSRVESGADCLLSTWTKVYAAMGFELHLLPTSAMGLEELEKRAEMGRPQGHWLRQRARPRRLWLNGRMVSTAEWKAERSEDRGLGG